MPQVDANIVTFLAGLFAALVQLVKGLVLDNEEAKRWLPLGIVFVATIVGMLLAFYYGRDPVVGLLEGMIGGLTSLGLYAAGKSVAPNVVNSKGWIRKD